MTLHEANTLHIQLMQRCEASVNTSADCLPMHKTLIENKQTSIRSSYMYKKKKVILRTN